MAARMREVRKSTVIDTPTLAIFCAVLLLSLFSDPLAVLAGTLSPVLGEGVSFLLSPAALVVLAGLCGAALGRGGEEK